MKSKPITPYQRLHALARDFVSDTQHGPRRPMWYYGKEKLNDGRWFLRDVFERVAAAHTLGWDVVLRTSEAGLHVEYVERVEPCQQLTWMLNP